MARPLPARTIQLPAGCVIDDAEIIAVLTLLNRAKEARDADLQLAYSNGVLSKRLLTLRSVGPNPSLIGGVRVRTEY